MRAFFLIIFGLASALILNPLLGLWHTPFLGTLPVVLIISGSGLANILLASIAMSLIMSMSPWIILLSLGVTTGVFLIIQRFIYLPLKTPSSIAGFIGRIGLGLIWYGLFTFIILMLNYSHGMWPWHQWVQILTERNLILGTLACMAGWLGLITILDNVFL
jgi:hypothetical protein